MSAIDQTPVSPLGVQSRSKATIVALYSTRQFYTRETDRRRTVSMCTICYKFNFGDTRLRSPSGSVLSRWWLTFCRPDRNSSTPSPLGVVQQLCDSCRRILNCALSRLLGDIVLWVLTKRYVNVPMAAITSARSLRLLI